MSETRKTAPVLDGLLIGDPISEHHGVQCCPAIRENTDERYIVKILSIPASQVQLDALLLTGAYSTPAHAMEYFQELANEVLKEVDILDRLSKLEGFLSYEATDLKKMTSRSGYQVKLLSTYKRSLERQMQLQPLTHLSAVNLGLDLCAALAICRRAGFLYVDLKPSNVFITPTQGCKIGDIGFISLSTLKYASLPERYHSSYTAPEIVDAMSTLTQTMDIYALGLVLYQVYNNGKLPFEGKAPSSPLPPPAYADYEMAEIILKACHPDPARRWADPLEMGQALAGYMQRNSINDTPIVPPPVKTAPEPEVPEPETETFTPEEENEEELGALLDNILGEPEALLGNQGPLPEISVQSETAGIDGFSEIDIPLPDDEPDAEPAPVEETVSEDTQADENLIPSFMDEGTSEAEEEDENLIPSFMEDTAPEAVEDDENLIPSFMEDTAPEAVEDDENLIPSFMEEPTSAYEIDLSLLDDADETLPNEENTIDLDHATVSTDVEEMLAQVDELISHELPEPAVAPDPVDIPFPAPIVPQDEDPAETSSDEPLEEAFISLNFGSENQSDDDSEQDVDEDFPADDDEDAADEDYEEEESYEDEEYDEDEDDEEDDDEEDDDDASEYIRISRPNKNKSGVLISLACVLVFLVSLCVGGVLFYQYYYLQPVNSMVIDGSVDSMSIEINSAIRDELLTVVCTDTYGNTREAEVFSGRAHFSNLTPNTQYRVSLQISGFHKLTGNTSGSYTTSAQTEILNFNAVAGTEEGSVILSFTVNGPENENWTVGYATGNQEEKTQSFTGHTVTVSNLTVGSDYLFRLIPSEDQFLTGSWQINYTPQQLVFAHELSIRSCGGGSLVAAWNVPEGLQGQEWTVRCYNDNGFDKTITTTEAQAEFVELDHAYGYTVEVTAVGMTQSASASVTANPITITNLTADTSSALAIKLGWTFTGTAPADGWIVDYTVNGSEPITLSTNESKIELPLYPGREYNVDVHPVGDQTFYGKPITVKTDKAPAFSKYGVKAEDMSFYMCRTPDKENWDRFDVTADAYVEEFKKGQKASFLVELTQDNQASDDIISVTFIVCNKDKIPVSSDTVKIAWDDMWNKRFCALDMPKLPDTAGEYSVEIYFNNQLVTTQPFKIV